MKICSKCTRELPVSKFNKRSASKDGLADQCIDCTKSRVYAWRQNNKERHNKNQREGMKNRIAGGLCKYCSSPRLPGHNLYCEKHYILKVAQARVSSSSNQVYETLKNKLEAQGWKCPYTNEMLVLGVNAQLDHILPISRFPELQRSLDNVEWVSTKVNLAKRDLTKQEFIELCQKVCSALQL